MGPTRLRRFAGALLLAGPLALPSLLAPPAMAQPAEVDLAAAVATETDCSLLAAPDGTLDPGLGEVSCGVLSVPENWRLPDGRRLGIRYAVLHAETPSPRPDPVIYLDGGPGGASLPRVGDYADLFAPLRAERDVVLFDQRGTGFSDPLRCAEWTLDDVFAIDLAVEPVAPPAAGVPPGPIDADSMLNAARAQVADGMARCAQQLIAAGVDLRQYNSIASANDVAALAQALGFGEINLYGISYGTRLALVVARDHPDIGLRSIVLDSTFPPEIHGFEQFPAEPHEVVLQLFADCARDEACAAAYPDLKGRFVGLLAALAEQPVVLPDGEEVGPDEVVAVMQGLTGAIGIVPWVPRLIAELERGETATWLAIRDGLVGGPAVADDGPPPEDAGTAMESADATPIADDDPVAELAQLIPWYAGDAEALDGADLFLGDVVARAGALPRDEGATLMLRLVMLAKTPPTRASLEGFVRRSFPAGDENRAAMLGLLHLLSDDDVAAVFERLDRAQTFIDPSLLLSNQLQFYSVECNEEIPFQRFEETARVAADLDIPELGLNTLPGLASIFAACEVWPSGRAPEIERQPVASAAPTLILAGAYDLQTPVSWNKSAFVHLPNAAFVLFPMAGHGVILYSDCAADIATAFVDDPRAAPDASCTADLRPEWAMPDDPLPSPDTLTPEDAADV
jgi:pimeloyl-ACP methyl ester carboxylesterase